MITKLITKAWTGPHKGPKGGTYWLSTLTGEKRYQGEKPGEAEEVGEPEPYEAPKGPAEDYKVIGHKHVESIAEAQRVRQGYLKDFGAKIRAGEMHVAMTQAPDGTWLVQLINKAPPLGEPPEGKPQYFTPIATIPGKKFARHEDAASAEEAQELVEELSEYAREKEFKGVTIRVIPMEGDRYDVRVYRTPPTEAELQKVGAKLADEVVDIIGSDKNVWAKDLSNGAKMYRRHLSDELGLTDLERERLDNVEESWTSYSDPDRLRKLAKERDPAIMTWKKAYWACFGKFCKRYKDDPSWLKGLYSGAGDWQLAKAVEYWEKAGDGEIPTKLTLYRGCSVPSERFERARDAKQVNLILHSADSWSLEPEIARSFASKNLKDERPVGIVLEFDAGPDDVLTGFPFTGFMDEWEMTTDGQKLQEDIYEIVNIEALPWKRKGREEAGWQEGMFSLFKVTIRRRPKRPEEEIIAKARITRGDYEPIDLTGDNDNRSPRNRRSPRLAREGGFQKASGWVRYQGPQGGAGWRNVSTSEVRYQQERPSEEGQAEPARSRAPGMAQVPTQPLRLGAKVFPGPRMAERHLQSIGGAGRMEARPEGFVVLPEPAVGAPFHEYEAYVDQFQKAFPEVKGELERVFGGEVPGSPGVLRVVGRVKTPKSLRKKIEVKAKTNVRDIIGTTIRATDYEDLGKMLSDLMSNFNVIEVDDTYLRDPSLGYYKAIHAAIKTEAGLDVEVLLMSYNMNRLKEWGHDRLYKGDQMEHYQDYLEHAQAWFRWVDGCDRGEDPGSKPPCPQVIKAKGHCFDVDCRPATGGGGA